NLEFILSLAFFLPWILFSFPQILAFLQPFLVSLLSLAFLLLLSFLLVLVFLLLFSFLLLSFPLSLACRQISYLSSFYHRIFCQISWRPLLLSFLLGTLKQ